MTMMPYPTGYGTCHHYVIGKQKMKNIRIIVAITLLFASLVSCKKSDELSLLKRKYAGIEKESKATLSIDSILIIEIANVPFEELAYIEFNRMNKLNDNLKQLVKIQFSMDSLYAIKLKDLKNENDFAFKEEEYYEKLRKDSVIKKEEMISRFNNEIEILENNKQMLKIEQLVKSDSTLVEESKWVKHKINYTLTNERYSDTLVLVIFGKSQYNYLTNNIFRKYE